MVAGQRYAAADGGDGAVENGKGRAWYFGFISSFIPATAGKRGGRRGIEKPRRDGERGALNYNPLPDTAEFAFKIKRA